MTTTKISHNERWSIEGLFPFDSIEFNSDNDVEGIITIYGFDGNIIQEISTNELEEIEDEVTLNILKSVGIIS